jgi:transglutaminase-like putative cysteine protease
MIADWLTTYQQRMGVCDGYARLFDIMLRLAGVKEVKYVS